MRLVEKPRKCKEERRKSPAGRTVRRMSENLAERTIEIETGTNNL